MARSTHKRDAIIIASPVAHTVKNLPLMQETRVGSVGQEDPLVKGMATHSSILAWRFHRPRSLAPTVHGVTKSRTRLSNLHRYYYSSHHV